MYDIIVVGGGPAGLSAAIHSANFGLRTLVLEAAEKVGGIATRAHGISNYPGFPRKISGLRLMERMMLQAERNGAEIHTLEEVVNLSLAGTKRLLKLESTSIDVKP